MVLSPRRRTAAGSRLGAGMTGGEPSTPPTRALSTKNQPLNPRHIPVPETRAHTCPVPPSDTPAGVLARRGRRWWWGNDVSPHHRGPRKMVSLRRHGERRRVTDQPSSLDARTARRACLCGTQGGRRRWCRRIFKSDERPGRKASGPGKPAESTSPQTSTERPKSRAKTAERGAERCHIN